MVSTFAFLHHVAAFALVAALAIEFVLIKDELTVRSARKLLFTDLVFGASAGVLLVVGLLRVLRRIVHWELIAVVVILLCAALMARGVGYVGR